jgi:hypothetical protein
MMQVGMMAANLSQSLELGETIEGAELPGCSVAVVREGKMIQAKGYDKIYPR